MKTVGYLNNFNRLNTVGTINKMNSLKGTEILETYALCINALLGYNKVEDVFLKQVHDVLLTQYSTNKGIKIFETKVTDSVETELRQLHDRKVIKPVLPEELSKEQKWKSLAYLMFIKEKRCGKIKGRGCADGRKKEVGWIKKTPHHQQSPHKH